MIGFISSVKSFNLRYYKLLHLGSSLCINEYFSKLVSTTCWFWMRILTSHGKLELSGYQYRNLNWSLQFVLRKHKISRLQWCNYNLPNNFVLSFQIWDLKDLRRVLFQSSLQYSLFSLRTWEILDSRVQREGQVEGFLFKTQLQRTFLSG